MFDFKDGIAIIKFMRHAQIHIAYPKIRLQSNDLTIQLSVAGHKAQMPDTINITDGKPYSQNVFYGRVLLNGTIQFGIRIAEEKMDAISHELNLFANNPIQYAKLYGSNTGNCMFCTRLLTDPQSVAVGYGPICAAHYGLPHGEIEESIANDMVQIEMPMVIPELTGE